MDPCLLTSALPVQRLSLSGDLTVTCGGPAARRNSLQFSVFPTKPNTVDVDKHHWKWHVVSRHYLPHVARHFLISGRETIPFLRVNVVP